MRYELFAPLFTNTFNNENASNYPVSLLKSETIEEIQKYLLDNHKWSREEFIVCDSVQGTFHAINVVEYRLRFPFSKWRL